VHDATGSAQVRRPRQARDHAIGTRLVKDHAKLPRERHERDQFIRVSWHDGTLPRDQPGPEGDEEEGAYDPEAAFTCDWSSADLIAAYRDECRRSDEVLTVTPLSAAPRGLHFHADSDYTRQITNVRWIVLHVIEETAAHSGHLEIARELLDGKIRLGGR
jgi:hypothetical protein